MRGHLITGSGATTENFTRFYAQWSGKGAITVTVHQSGTSYHVGCLYAINNYDNSTNGIWDGICQLETGTIYTVNRTTNADDMLIIAGDNGQGSIKTLGAPWTEIQRETGYGDLISYYQVVSTIQIPTNVWSAPIGIVALDYIRQYGSPAPGGGTTTVTSTTTTTTTTTTTSTTTSNYTTTQTTTTTSNYTTTSTTTKYNTTTLLTGVTLTYTQNNFTETDTHTTVTLTYTQPTYTLTYTNPSYTFTIPIQQVTVINQTYTTTSPTWTTTTLTIPVNNITLTQPTWTTTSTTLTIPIYTISVINGTWTTTVPTWTTTALTITNLSANMTFTGANMTLNSPSPLEAISGNNVFLILAFLGGILIIVAFAVQNAGPMFIGGTLIMIDGLFLTHYSYTDTAGHLILPTTDLINVGFFVFAIGLLFMLIAIVLYIANSLHK
jgi:hypothetical protein